MKKITTLLVLAVLATSAFQSCKKDEEKKPVSTSSNAQPNAMKLTVDGVVITPPTLVVQESGGVILFQGVIDANTTYTISTTDEIMPGTYSIDGDTPFDLFHTTDNNASFYATTSGSVTITAHDTVNDKMSGTFSGVLSHSGGASPKIVTNGSFNFNY